jgi:hypothetical protein
MKKRYRYLEDLLFKGFIPCKLNISGVNFVLKSINENEYENIKLMSGLESDPKYATFFNINYLFYSIFMIDGVNILKKREDFYIDFFQNISQLPSSFLKTIFPILEDLAKIQSNCSSLVEQYCYEEDSRYNWEYKKNIAINSPQLTSIAGTDILGINNFQRYWMILNIREDRKINFKENYSLFKFLASFTDSKAVRKIEQQEKVAEEEEEKRKERIRVMGTEEEIKYLSSPTDTREGIIESLEKQMRGEKDEHDLFIEEYEKNIRKQMLKQMNEMTKVREMRKKQIDSLGDEIRPISTSELEERIRKVKERKENINNSVSEVSLDQSSKFYQMSNVKDEDIIREEHFISDEDYRKLIGDEEYQKLSGIDDLKKAEEEYQKQQKTIASKYGFDDLDESFPHIKR